MRVTVGGFQPFTLSDFPGRPAAVVFTRGCNFRCPFCHNGQLIGTACNGPGDEGVEQVWSFLERRRGRLEGVVVSGGEPTLQPDLLPFLEGLREMGFMVKLDTNGSRPTVLKELLRRRVVDYVAMDVKAPIERYGDLAGVDVDGEALLESIRTIAGSGVDHEFRTTRVEPLLSDGDLDAIRAILPTGSKYKVQPFRPEAALDPRLRS